MRVRVEGSTKRFTTVLPRKRRNFFDGAFADRFERARGVEHGDDFFGA